MNVMIRIRPTTLAVPQIVHTYHIIWAFGKWSPVFFLITIFFYAEWAWACFSLFSKFKDVFPQLYLATLGQGFVVSGGFELGK